MKGMQDTNAKWALAALLCDVWRATERWNFVYQDNNCNLSCICATWLWAADPTKLKAVVFRWSFLQIAAHHKSYAVNKKPQKWKLPTWVSVSGGHSVITSKSYKMFSSSPSIKLSSAMFTAVRNLRRQAGTNYKETRL